MPLKILPGENYRGYSLSLQRNFSVGLTPPHAELELATNHSF
jgi:hypothetical protein